MAKTYLQKWKVPSKSNPSKDPYTVSITDKGDYECSCPAWKFRSPRKDCHHIDLVKANPDMYGSEFNKAWPTIVLANVLEVTRDEDNNLLTPLIPLNNPPFTATVMYDLLRHGVPWGEVKERYGKFISFSQGGVTKSAVIDWIHRHGRTVMERRGDTLTPAIYTNTWDGLTL